MLNDVGCKKEERRLRDEGVLRRNYGNADLRKYGK